MGWLHINLKTRGKGQDSLSRLICVSRGNIASPVCKMQPFLSPPKTMLWMTNKTAFSLQKKYPSFRGFFIFHQLCLVTEQHFSSLVSSLACVQVNYSGDKTLHGAQLLCPTLRWWAYGRAMQRHIVWTLKMRALCLLQCTWCMWKQTCFHSSGIPVHKHFLQSAPGMCEQQPGPCGTGTPVVKWNSSPENNSPLKTISLAFSAAD